MLVGYGTTKKGYRLYDLENRVFFVSRDVMFMEKIFPFKGSCTDQQILYESHNDFIYDKLVTIPPITIPVTSHSEDVDSSPIIPPPEPSSNNSHLLSLEDQPENPDHLFGTKTTSPNLVPIIVYTLLH